MTLGEKEQEFLAALRVSGLPLKGTAAALITGLLLSCSTHWPAPITVSVHLPSWMSTDLFCSVQAYYYDEKSLLSNEEFDNLKEDLIWAGSKVAVLRYAHGGQPGGSALL